MGNNFLDASSVYAAPTGLSTNSGTYNSPYDLATGLLALEAGKTLYLLGGIYNGNFTASQSGSAGNFTTIRPFPGARAIINGQMSITGNYVRVIGLEVANNTSRNRSAMVGTVGFDCLGDYNEIVNCLIRDHDQGLTTSATKTGHVYYGNLFCFNGWDSQLGHGTYPQNNVGNTKTIKNNIFIDNFGYNIHAYGGSGAVSDFIVDGNTCAESGAPRNTATTSILNGGSIGVSGSILRNNRTYQREGIFEGRMQIGYGTGNTATGMQVYDNYLVSPSWSLVFLDATLTRFDGNTIIGWFDGDGVGIGTNTNISPHPSDPVVYPTTDNQVFLTANDYDANRAQLTIYNWTLGNTVDVDVSSVFGATGTVEAHNAQNYFTDIQTLTITAGVITVNMQAANRTVATPVGWTAPAKTFPQFGAFILVKQ
jgi:hypothetical protein